MARLGEPIPLVVVMSHSDEPMQAQNADEGWRNQETLSASLPIRIVMIGPWSASVGGTVVLFRQLVNDLRAYPGVHVSLVDTGRKAPGRVANALVALRTFATIMREARHANVITFHASVRAVTWFSPFVAVTARLHGRPWMLRVFGGNLDHQYHESSSFVRYLMRHTAFSADLCMFETRYLVDRLETLCQNRVEWLPNSRPQPSNCPKDVSALGARRFVYLGIVKPSKGIRTLIEASNRLHASTDGRTEVHVYGPLAEGVTPSDFAGITGIQYGGEVPPAAVADTLADYDVLVLPTTYEGEGYPGVILEAYGAGLPVVATRWRAIPELVDDTCGVLVEPRDADDLLQGLLMLTDPGEYRKRTSGLRAKREQFASERWTARFVAWCRDLAADRASANE